MKASRKKQGNAAKPAQLFRDTATGRFITTREAKNQLSAVIREAIAGGDVTVTSDGKPAVVIVAADRYREMQRQQSGLVAFFQASPLAGARLDIERSREIGRDIDLQ